MKYKLHYLFVLLFCFFFFAIPVYMANNLINDIKRINFQRKKITNGLAEFIVKSIVRFIDNIFLEKREIIEFTPESTHEYFWTRISIYILFFLFLLSFLIDFISNAIDKQAFDTIIVVMSLVSLALGRLFEIYNNDKFYLYISFCLKTGSYSVSLWLLLITTLDCIFNSCRSIGLAGLVTILLISFFLLILSKLVRIKNRERLLFVFWWIFILILYGIKIKTSPN